MVEITRALCKKLAAVFKRGFGRPRGPLRPAIEIHTDAHGLHVRSVYDDIGIEYREAGTLRPAAISLPIDALGTVQGRDASVVTFEADASGQVQARWSDAGVPQATTFAAHSAMPAFPKPPDTFVSNPQSLLAALDEAMRTATPDATRYALQRVQFRGRTGDVVATDSKILFREGGFDFGWTEDILAARTLAFGCPDLCPCDEVEIGKTESHVAIGAGPWTIYLAIDTTGRYPPYEQIIPKPSATNTTCRFERDDVEFLLQSLPRLPGQKDSNKPLTMDLNGQVSVRAKAEDQPQVTELVLSRTEYTGTATRINMNRDHLARALQLGFTSLDIVNADKPYSCRDDRRTFVMMPLSKEGALAATADSLRISSATMERPLKIHQPRQEKKPMSTPSTNGHAPAIERGQTSHENPTTNRIGMAALISDAQALREATRSTFNQAGRLLVALKRHRKQSKLMATTLKSLKDLQSLEA